jgi:hypothetical protein
MVDMRLLVIDDVDMTDITNSLRGTLSGNQINLTSSFIHLNSDFYDNQDKLDLSLIRDAVKRERQQGRFDLIMVDYNYGNAHGLNGISIIQMLREIFPKESIILYTGLRQEVIKELIKTGRGTGDINPADLEQIASRFDDLMKMKIEAFIRRDGFVSEATKMLKQKKYKDVKELLIDKLSQHTDLVVRAQGMRGINGKTLKDIIESLNSDAQAQNWLDEILDELIAYLTKIYE